MLAIFFRLYDGKIYRTIYDVPALKKQPPVKGRCHRDYLIPKRDGIAINTVLSSVLLE